MKITIPDERGENWQSAYVGRHWSKRKARADELHQLVRAHIDPNATPYEGRVDVWTTVYFRNRPMDPDNICDKMLIDGLCGWVVKDDDRRYIRWAGSRSEIDKDNPRIEIEVVPVE